MVEQKIPQCFICHIVFEDFKELARHITQNRKIHGNRSYFWAQSVLTDVNRLNSKEDRPQRVPLSEEDAENKLEARRELSGVDKVTQTICPSCNSIHLERLPIEHVENPMAWKQKNKLLVLCMACNKSSTKRHF